MFKTFRALRQWPFACLWSGQTVSRLGDKLYNVALAWWILEKTGSALAMGTVLLFTTIPMVALLLMGGVMVDRFPRLRLMLISDLARGLIVSMMAGLAFTDTLQIWQVCVFSLVFGFVDAFFHPAYRAVVPQLTPKDDLPSANSLTSLSRELSGIAGPAIGAAAVALFGAPAAFAMNGLSFFISAVCLLPILKLDGSFTPASTSKNVLGDLREGLGAVLASPWLWVTIAVAGISNITYAGPMDVGLPFLIKEHLRADVGTLGSFYSLMSLGSVLAAFWLGRYSNIRRRGLKLYASWIPIGVLVAIMGAQTSVPVILVIGLAMGMCNTALGLVWTNMLQECVPTHLLGRVSSVDYFGSYILLPIGMAMGGWAVESFGSAPVFVVGGICTALLISTGLLHPQIRNLD